jgi:hypothetical protein
MSAEAHPHPEPHGIRMTARNGVTAVLPALPYNPLRSIVARATAASER